MRSLIVEDDLTTRKLLQIYLSDYGDCFAAINGHEAVEAFEYALDKGEPYGLICLDIMMPGMNGYEALKAIRKAESDRGIKRPDGVKVIMTTVLSDDNNVTRAFETGCEAYLVKPVDKEKLLAEMGKLGLIAQQVSE